MSGIYALEPNTRGKLTLHTTKGDISVALFSDSCPRGVRNIVQLSLNSYYDNLTFHRVVPDVLVQTGDPTGTGSGGASAFPLRVESHGRLKFRRRGLVALVADNDGKCGSQFFITLGETPWLNGAHTIIGSVQGNTFFNVIALSEAANDPESLPRVTSITVDDNPFPKVIRTVKDVPVLNQAPKSNVSAVRNKRLLSFADDEDDDSDDEKGCIPKKAKSFPAAVPTASDEAEHSASKPPSKKKSTGGNAEFAKLLALARKKKTARKKANPEPSVTPGPLPPPVPSLTKKKRADEIGLSTGNRRKKSNSRDAEVLRKLANFEKRLTSARTSEETGSWFAQPLKLSGAHSLDGKEEEYVAVEGIPKLDGK